MTTTEWKRDLAMTFMLRLGNWMLTERGLFRLRQHSSAKSGKAVWWQWDRIIPPVRLFWGLSGAIKLRLAQ